MKMMHSAKGYGWYVTHVLQTMLILGIYSSGESEVDFAMVVKSFLCLALFFTYPGMD